MDRGEYPSGHEGSMARYFRGCAEFKGFCDEFKTLKNSIVRRGLRRLPQLLFSRLSPAVHFVLKGMCRYLKNTREGASFVCDVRVRFDAFKDICRYDTQPDGIDEESFTVELCRLYNELEKAVRDLANFVERFEMMQTMADLPPPDTVPPKKGHSTSVHAGEKFNGVLIERDQRTLRIGGESMHITSKSNWRIVDAIVEAHFAAAWATLPSRAFANFTTADEKRFLAYIEREEYRIGDPHRKGNRRYTGRARLNSKTCSRRQPLD